MYPIFVVKVRIHGRDPAVGVERSNSKRPLKYEPMDDADVVTTFKWRFRTQDCLASHAIRSVLEIDVKLMDEWAATAIYRVRPAVTGACTVPQEGAENMFPERRTV
jgi:hypothetical protein